MASKALKAKVEGIEKYQMRMIEHYGNGAANGVVPMLNGGVMAVNPEEYGRCRDQAVRLHAEAEEAVEDAAWMSDRELKAKHGAMLASWHGIDPNRL